MWSFDTPDGPGHRSLAAAFILASAIALPLALALGMMPEAPQPPAVSLDTAPPPPVQLASP